MQSSGKKGAETCWKKAARQAGFICERKKKGAESGAESVLACETRTYEF